MTGRFSQWAARFGMHGLWLACAASALLAWQFTSLHYQARLADLERAHAGQAERASQEALQQLQAAQRHGDQLTARLQLQDARLSQLQKDKAHALYSLTSGRDCLSAGAVRVLNGQAAAPASGLPAATAGAAAAGEPVATDTDVAQWIAHAQQHHEQCRQRLDALIDFHQPSQP